MKSSAAGNYHDGHASFVSTEKGTSAVEVLKILLSISITPLLSSLIFPWVVPPNFVKQTSKDHTAYMYIRALIDYPVIILMPLCILTTFAGSDPKGGDDIHGCDVVCLVLLCICFGIIIVNHSVTAPKWDGWRQFWDRIKHQPLSSCIPIDQISEGNLNPENLKRNEEKTDLQFRPPYLTIYRAITIYVTIIAILAVDFPIFPRRFAKTRIHGISLMDIGTGSFVFMNGLFCSEAKGKTKDFHKSIRSCIPLVALGVVRLLSVKGMEYHEVVEEYGLHWNFFFTLAAVKLCSTCVFTIVDVGNSLKVAIIVITAYEILLSYFGVSEHFILNQNVPRTDFINANREGLFSVFGYLTIYLISVYLGVILHFSKPQSLKGWSLYGCKFSIHSIMLCIMFYTLHVYIGPSCRRTANSTYCLWVVATNCVVLLFLLCINIIQSALQHLGLLHGPLISFELQAHCERETAKQNQQLFSKNVDASEDVDVEIRMEALEHRLRDCIQNKKATCERSEVSDLLKEAEVELKEIERKISEEYKENMSKYIALPDLTKSPMFLEAISYNGLFVFLLGNILTGVVNLLTETKYTSSAVAGCYLWVYVSVITLTSTLLYVQNIQLKFW